MRIYCSVRRMSRLPTQPRLTRCQDESTRESGHRQTSLNDDAPILPLMERQKHFTYSPHSTLRLPFTKSLLLNANRPSETCEPLFTSHHDLFAPLRRL